MPRSHRPGAARLASVNVMSIVGWIIVGLIAGGLARWIVKDDRSGCLYTMIVGVLGALIGGWLMSTIDSDGVEGFSLRSIGVAAIGAVLLLLVLQAIAGRGVSRGR
jgi:uncharacterized membrane protein YeaQ/YmgE (transglycosylase-associated protein family)